MKIFERVLWVVAIVGFIAGGYGIYDRVVNGHGNAAYGSFVPWGLWIGAYIYLVGISAGSFLISTLVYAFGIKRFEGIGKLALFTSLVALGVAMFSVWVDLGRPERALRLMTNTNFGSMMGWMFWFYAAFALLLLVELWLALRADFVAWGERKDIAGAVARLLVFGRRDVSSAALARDHSILRMLGVLGVPLVVAFPGGAGALFGVVGARPYWNSGLTPILFLFGSLLSGCALLTFVTYVFGPDRGSQDHKATVQQLGRIVLGLLLMFALLEWAEYSITLYTAIPADAASMRLVLFGPFAWVFWGVHVGLGVLVPLLLLAWQGKSPLWAGIAGLLIAATFLTVRLNIVIPGLAVPELQGLQEAFSGPGLSFDYFPTLTEWLLQIWIVSLGVLVFLTGYHLLPIVTTRLEARRG